MHESVVLSLLLELVFVVEEYSFELLETDHTVLGLIVLAHYLVQLLLGDFVPDLVHGSYNILSRNLT